MRFYCACLAILLCLTHLATPISALAATTNKITSVYGEDFIAAISGDTIQIQKTDEQTGKKEPILNGLIVGRRTEGGGNRLEGRCWFWSGPQIELLRKGVADLVTLKDGRKLEGQVTKVGPIEFTLVTKTEIVQIRWDTVQQISSPQLFDFTCPLTGNSTTFTVSGTNIIFSSSTQFYYISTASSSISSPGWLAELAPLIESPSEPIMSPSEPTHTTTTSGGGGSSSDCISQMYYFKDGSVAGFVRTADPGKVVWYTEDGTQPDPSTLRNPPKSQQEAKQPNSSTSVSDKTVSKAGVEKNSGNEAQMAMTPPKLTVPAESTVTATEAQNSGKMEVGLEGDGQNTFSCKLILRNTTGSNLTVDIEDFIFFVPVNSTDRQGMCKLPGTLVSIPKGESITKEIQTMCVSTKLEKPPGPASDNVSYRIGPYPDPKVGEMLIHIIKTAEKLEQEKAFADVSINPEKRWRKIAQTSIWRYLGDRTPRKEDDITPATLKSDLLTGSGKMEKDLSPVQRKDFDSLIQAIISAVDKTLKQASK